MKLSDKRLIKDYLAVVSIIGLLITFTIKLLDVSGKYKGATGVVGLILVLLTLYIILWIRANFLNIVKMKINNSIIEVKIGDIFEENELKVIAFNEYFDTLVDNKVISNKTLNGLYLIDFVENVNELDSLINADEHLNDTILESNSSRLSGKKKKYKLGTVFQHNDYLLTAFSRFDKDNRAYLNINDYINFLINFWNEIDIVYAGRSISIPLLGSGITRFKEYDMISEQELLELLIWSFKVSRIKFTYPSQVSIVIHESKKDKINFYKLRGVENGFK